MYQSVMDFCIALWRWEISQIEIFLSNPVQYRNRLAEREKIGRSIAMLPVRTPIGPQLPTAALLGLNTGVAHDLRPERQVDADSLGHLLGRAKAGETSCPG